VRKTRKLYPAGQRKSTGGAGGIVPEKEGEGRGVGAGNKNTASVREKKKRRKDGEEQKDSITKTRVLSTCFTLSILYEN